MNLIGIFTSIPSALLPVVVFLIVLILFFVLLFLVPSISLWLRLRRVSRGLVEIKKQASTTRQVVDPHAIAKSVMKGEPFNHLWSEYVETLHDQFTIVDGEEKLVDRRATLPAETFFRGDVLVDIPLKAEFFKHLPGLFTGLGIIGTFLGLIQGLNAFSDGVSGTDDQKVVRQHLNALLKTVSHAFVVSAGSITAAMVATFLEKMAITAHYKQVEEICQLIDSLYTAGAGEEYLARLVKASEESATQTTQLKDSLVADLREMMTNLVDRQIQATQESHQALGITITQSITAPINALTKVVERTTGNQGEAVQKTLTDVVSGFMEKLEKVFGGQITELTSLMKETTGSVRETRDQFAELLKSLSTAGGSAGEKMGEQLKLAMKEAEIQQSKMNAQMEKFIEQIQALISKSQSETSTQLNLTLRDLGLQVQKIMEGLSEQQAKAGREAQVRQDEISGQAEATVNTLGNTVGVLTKQTSEVLQGMRDTIDALKSITIESIQKMNAGAETLYVASSDFSKAGQSVAGVFERASQISEKLSAAAAGLDSATKTVQLSVAAYERTRSDVVTMVESLRTIIESAKHEAGLSKELVTQLESAAAKLSVAQTDADAYLGRVSSVLEETFASFTDSMAKAVDKARVNTDVSLSNAVEMLRATIDDLGEGLDGFRRENK